jgi:hypothetical protein
MKARIKSIHVTPRASKRTASRGTVYLAGRFDKIQPLKYLLTKLADQSHRVTWFGIKHVGCITLTWLDISISLLEAAFTVVPPSFASIIFCNTQASTSRNNNCIFCPHNCPHAYVVPVGRVAAVQFLRNQRWCLDVFMKYARGNAVA